jgi:hypothetical protein
LDVIEAVRAVNAIQPEVDRPHNLRPRLNPASTGGNLVLRADKVTIGYPGNALFSIHDLSQHANAPR